MSLANDYRRKLRRESGAGGLLAAVGVVALIAGLVIVGVVAGRREVGGPERQLEVQSVEAREPTEGALRAAAEVVAARWMRNQYRVEVAEHAVVIKYGADLYVVTGSLQDAGQTKLYEAKMRWRGGQWIVEVVTVNGQDW